MMLRVSEIGGSPAEDTVTSPAFRAFLTSEETAASISEFAFSMISGLLQTEAYARAITSASPVRYSPAKLEALVARRMRRQWRALERRDPPRLVYVLDEAVLHRALGGVEILREQLLHLSDIAALPHVSLQVLPFVPLMSAIALPQTDFSIIRPVVPDQETVLYFQHGVEDRSTVSAYEVREYQELFHSVCAASLSPEESLATILRSAQALEG